MPKYSTNPTLYEDCKTISITKLKEWNYFKPNQFFNGTITWSRNENVTGTISFMLCTNLDNPFIQLVYTSNDTIKVNYKIQLVSVPSNIGKGVIWYFLCPKTNKRCRKLYLVDTYFYHRTAFSGCMYEKQTQNNRTKNLNRLYDRIFKSDEARCQVYDKHFKKHYNGKYTKRYVKLLRQMRGNEEITMAELLLKNIKQ